LIRCPTKMKIWKDTCPAKEEKLFPALLLQRQSVWLNRCIPLVKEKIKRYLGNSCFEKNVAWRLYCMCKVIRYVVLTMHYKLKLWLSYLKELYVRSEIPMWKLPLIKKKSAAMPFGSEALLSQLFISLNTSSKHFNMTWSNTPRLQSTVKKYVFVYNVNLNSCG